MTAQDSSGFHWRFDQFNDQDIEIRGKTLFVLLIIFSFIILVVLFVLYARWVCRYDTNYQDHDHPTSHHTLPPPPPPPRPQGLDSATIEMLPVILHKSLSANSTTNYRCDEESECCICLSEFDGDDKVKVLPECQHCYHSDCIDKWLIAQSSCPLCRASPRVDPPLDSALSQTVTE